MKSYLMWFIVNLIYKTNQSMENNSLTALDLDLFNGMSEMYSEVSILPTKTFVEPKSSNEAFDINSDSLVSSFDRQSFAVAHEIDDELLPSFIGNRTDPVVKPYITAHTQQHTIAISGSFVLNDSLAYEDLISSFVQNTHSSTPPPPSSTNRIVETPYSPSSPAIQYISESVSYEYSHDENASSTSVYVTDTSSVVNTPTCSLNRTKPLSHEFSILFHFNHTNEALLVTDELFLKILHYIKYYFHDPDCLAQMTAFINGTSSVFSWTNKSLDKQQCDIIAIESVWSKMVKKEQVKPEFIELFYPYFKITKVQKMYLGECLEMKSSTSNAIIVPIAILIPFLVLLFLTVFVIIHMRHKERKIAKKFDEVFILHNRPPMILPMEK